MPRVSVVIPTIEEESVFGLVDSLHGSLGSSAEIIIVDKSSDKYYKRLKATGATVLRQRDRGVERAIMQGLRYAHGDVLASIDADQTHDISGIVDGIRMIRQDKADFVLGNRMNDIEDGAMGTYLKIGNFGLSWLFSRLYGTNIHDVLTGLFVMKREAFDKIRDVDPYRAGIAFFAIELAKLGYRVREVDIRYYKRRLGTSKLTRSKFIYGVNVASHLIRQLRDYSPLLIFGGLGVVAGIVGLFLGLGVLVDFANTGVFTQTGRALLAFMLVVLGFLLVVAGLILDMLLEIEKGLAKR